MLGCGAALLAASDDTGAIFVAAQGRAADQATSVLSTLGARIGDLAILSATSSAPVSGSGGAWANTNGPAQYRLLTAGDLTAGVSNGNAPFALVIYRGPATLARVAFDAPPNGSTDQRTVAGFTRNPKHAGLMFIIAGPNADGDIDVPGNTVLRAIGQNAGQVTARMKVSDALYSSSDVYHDGDPILWTPTDGSNFALNVYELRSA
jgi:hypothetical protein